MTKRDSLSFEHLARFASPAVLAAALMVTGVAQAQSVLTHHVPAEVSSGALASTGQLPATQVLTLHVVLPLGDPDGLTKFLSQVYTPGSGVYRQFVTVPEFTERFGPSQADYETVVGFLESSGLSVIGGSRDGMDVLVKGSVSTVESTFHVTLRTYQDPVTGRTFFAPDREPSANLSLNLWHVSGLDSYANPHPLFARKPDGIQNHATTGSGPSASFLGSDMRAAYYGGSALTGAGQNLGLFEYEGTDLADLTTYFKNVGQTNNVPITLLSTDGTSTSCVYSSGCDDTEQTLDMTQAIGMAPGLASMVVYVGSVDTAIISAMTTHSPLPTTIGCSWGWTPADPSTLDPYFEKMSAQGQNFFAASGDSSTWSSKVEAWPADDDYVVSVGGTDLTTSSAAGPWKSETAWASSGGGISPDKIAIPSWQQLAGVINSSNKGSTTYRNGPDVSANANYSFYVCADQTTCTANEYGGTSFAAPMWAGFIALVNQQLAENGDATLGFIDPTIYAQNVTSSYSTDFHDITSGTSGSYSAVTGYDLVTGWGSPQAALITALAGGNSGGGPSFSISASPSSVSIKQGSSGSSTISTSVSGGFDSAIALSASGEPSGVTVSFSPTSIAAPGSGSSTMNITVASTVSTGTYTITVSGSGGSIVMQTSVSLTVTGTSTGTFTISVSPTSGYLDRGQSGYAVVTTKVSGGFDASISFSATGVPSGVTTSFTPASIGAPGSGTTDFNLTVSESAPTGTYPIKITGTGGGVTESTTLSFQVRR